MRSVFKWCLTLELNMVNRRGPPPWLRGQFRRRVLVIIRGVACLICHVHFSCERFLAVAAFSSALASPVWQCVVLETSSFPYYKPTMPPKRRRSTRPSSNGIIRCRLFILPGQFGNSDVYRRECLGRSRHLFSVDVVGWLTVRGVIFGSAPTVG